MTSSIVFRDIVHRAVLAADALESGPRVLLGWSSSSPVNDSVSIDISNAGQPRWTYQFLKYAIIQLHLRLPALEHVVIVVFEALPVGSKLL